MNIGKNDSLDKEEEAYSSVFKAKSEAKLRPNISPGLECLHGLMQKDGF